VANARRRGRPRLGTRPAGAIRVVWTTLPARNARAVADALVQERLAACVNAIPRVRSVYRWKGKVERASETLLLVKAPARRLQALVRRLVELHPYELPEVLVFRPERGLPSYVRWVATTGGMPLT